MAFEPRPGCPCTWCTLTRSLDRFTERLAAEDAMKDTLDEAQSYVMRNGRFKECFTPRDENPLPLIQRLMDENAKMRQERVERQLVYDELSKLRAENKKMRAERSPDLMKLGRIAAVLATFYRSTLSMSSVQPLLALAEELNPSLRETK